jgi:hypothetical protein
MWQRVTPDKLTLDLEQYLTNRYVRIECAVEHENSVYITASRMGGRQLVDALAQAREAVCPCQKLLTIELVAER